MVERRGRGAKPNRARLHVRLAKPAEGAIYLLVASGLLLFDPFGLPWSLVRWALVIHVLMAIIFVPALLIPFWISHRSILGIARRRFQIVSGRLLEGGLGLIFVTGLWLLVIGWNGNTSGTVAHWTHLVLAVPLTLLVVVHAWRYSAFKWLLSGLLAAALLVGASSSLAAAAAAGAVASRSLILGATGTTLLSADFDGGSVTRIDRASGRRLTESVLGGTLTSLAVDPDDQLVAVSDFTGNRLLLLARDSLAVEESVALAGHPAGVVYDARNHLFWVAATEGDKLYGISPQGDRELTLGVARSPRGLALLPDGRLLVSHSLIGAVSIYDTTALPPKRLKFISLAVSQNPDQTVSQGLPRGLDRIAVSPDGKQAWLPHMLWNFDHPFQFQSTVFPAISVLSLKPGQEHEAVSRRKELFKQINIIEDGTLARIVSNPVDVAFSNDGAKVYVTMAGSEDLVVFDLTRALPISSRSKKAATTQGAKAVEIFRHLPGAEPRGLVVAGRDIFVQNAMSLDLTKLDTGGSGSFARVKMVVPSFAKLVAQDPLPPALRRGERLFDLADTSIFPDAPMTGDNWMSCSSCHLDGFNFSNRALFDATPVDKFHSAFTGHGSITRLVAGDFIGDYIRMVRNTQGGMGADTRFPIVETDPDHPSKAVKAMMRDLHAYVTSPNNLPLLATWLRGDGGGPSVRPKDLINSAACGGCHSQAFKDWSNSMHHLMGQSDPYYMVLEDRAAADVGKPFRAWCMGCHAPQALLTGATRTTGPSHLFETDGASLMASVKDYLHATDEGTGCLFCHRVDKIEDAGESAGANASLNIGLADRPTYPGETAGSSTVRFFADRLIHAHPEDHAASLMPKGLGSGKFCAACHEEFTPGNGAVVVDTYTEWKKSSFNAPNDPARNRTCLDCHMHADVTRIGQAIPGRSTDGGPLEANVVSHNFVGAQYHLVGLRDPKAAAQSIALLRSAAKLSLVASSTDRFTVRVRNVGAGHRLPTGVSDFRQMWLDVTAVDTNGKVVLSSGRLDAKGKLDPGARLFQKVLSAKDGHLVGLDFWRYAKMHADTRIPPDGYRDEKFVLPSGTHYPVNVTVRLMYRTFPQWITDLVRKRFPDMPPPKAVEMQVLSSNLGPS